MKSRQFFVGNIKNAVLTFLTHSADSVLFHAQLVTEFIGGFSTAHASATRHRKSSGPPEDVEADVFEFCDHSFTFHGNKVSEKSVSVNEFFRKKCTKKIVQKCLTETWGDGYNGVSQGDTPLPPQGGGGGEQESCQLGCL